MQNPQLEYFLSGGNCVTTCVFSIRCKNLHNLKNYIKLTKFRKKNKFVFYDESSYEGKKTVWMSSLTCTNITQLSDVNHKQKYPLLLLYISVIDITVTFKKLVSTVFSRVIFFIRTIIDGLRCMCFFTRVHRPAQLQFPIVLDFQKFHRTNRPKNIHLFVLNQVHPRKSYRE